MAVFGAPVAHEDDPERAVRAGLAMQAAMEEINDGIAGATGVELLAARRASTPARCSPAQVGDGYTVIGDAVNVAARLQAAGQARQRHRRRDHLPADPRRDRVRASSSR